MAALPLPPEHYSMLTRESGITDAVRMVYLPPVAGKKVGVDDFPVAGHSLQDLKALVEAPAPRPNRLPVRLKCSTVLLPVYVARWR